MKRSTHQNNDSSFKSSEGLRALLERLHQDNGAGWRDDSEAAALMRHAADRYAALARKHGLDPWEAAAAAFDAMRSPSIRRADDPWAMVTRAVQVTCIAEERARGLLCSVHQARRPRYSVFHDAERFSDRENSLLEFHPAFRSVSLDPEPSPRAEGVERRSKTPSLCSACSGGRRIAPGRRPNTSAHDWPIHHRARRPSRHSGATTTPALCWTSPSRPGQRCSACCSETPILRSLTRQTVGASFFVFSWASPSAPSSAMSTSWPRS